MTVTWRDVNSTVRWTDSGRTYIGTLIKVPVSGSDRWYATRGHATVRTDDGHLRIHPHELEVVEEAECPASAPSASTANRPASGAGPVVPPSPLSAATGSGARAAAGSGHGPGPTTAAPPAPTAGTSPSVSSPSCPHGYASPASCVDCMLDGPVAPARPDPAQRLVTSSWTTARFAGRCARDAGHAVDPGDRIGYLDGIGWSCEDCAR